MTETSVYWEPCSFNVGDRVRVRLSGECGQSTTPLLRGVPQPQLRQPHAAFQCFDGVTGTIVETEAQEPKGHRFEVEFDSAVSYAGFHSRHAYFAAVELEPLTEEQAS